jgi:hypothetical protein
VSRQQSAFQGEASHLVCRCCCCCCSASAHSITRASRQRCRLPIPRAFKAVYSRWRLSTVHQRCRQSTSLNGDTTRGAGRLCTKCQGVASPQRQLGTFHTPRPHGPRLCRYARARPIICTHAHTGPTDAAAFDSEAVPGQVCVRVPNPIRRYRRHGAGLSSARARLSSGHVPSQPSETYSSPGC